MSTIAPKRTIGWVPDVGPMSGTHPLIYISLPLPSPTVGRYVNSTSYENGVMRDCPALGLPCEEDCVRGADGDLGDQSSL